MRGKVRALVLDGADNYLIFTPLVDMAVGVPAKWTIEQHLLYWVTAIPIAMFGGMFFGRFLNWWRSRWNYQ